MKRLLLLLAVAGGTPVLYGQPASFDVIIRNGVVIDGSGNPRFEADVAVRNGFIVDIGNLSGASAKEVIDANGLIVAPGFINIHSHASPEALPTAVNMLTQGVTTEIFNADGAGPLDVSQQMEKLSAAGLALNVGGYIGFNSIWQTVVGAADRRPTPAEIERMRSMITAGLEQGAWGVSAGLDYKPGYFATTEEVVRIVDVAKSARTNFTNHDRLTPETNFSTKVAIEETLAIGERTGLVPVVTHMKIQGREQGTAGAVLATMGAATKRGRYTAADAYPYLAGQSGLGALIIPGWAQEGGRPEMLKRFADPATRARIIKESEEAMAARFGGPTGVYLPRTQQELTDVMREMNAGAAETIIRILEKDGDPGAILRFGAEEDLVKILKDPATSMACDCGASTATRVHPRFYGSYPRVLGRYVREQKVMSLEAAIRKSSLLPASTVGMTDRGLIALGMAADIAIFDPNTIIDRATYDNPALPSEGMKHVLVNGIVALKGGVATGSRAGLSLRRTVNMPSRPITDARRSLRLKGSVDGRVFDINVSQGAGARRAGGRFIVKGLGDDLKLGTLQVADGWAHLTGAGATAFTLTADLRDPTAPGHAIVVLTADGQPAVRFTLPASTVEIK